MAGTINQLSGFRPWIIVSTNMDQTGLFVQHQVVFWLAAPAGTVIPRPGTGSRLPTAPAIPWGITSTELSALQAGTIVEQALQVNLFASNITTGSLQNVMDACYNSLQTQLNSTAQTQVSSHLPGMYLSSDGVTLVPGP